MMYSYMGRSMRPMGNSTDGMSPYDVYPTKDGHCVIATPDRAALAAAVRADRPARPDHRRADQVEPHAHPQPGRGRRGARRLGRRAHQRRDRRGAGQQGAGRPGLRPRRLGRGPPRGRPRDAGARWSTPTTGRRCSSTARSSSARTRPASTAGRPASASTTTRSAPRWRTARKELKPRRGSRAPCGCRRRGACGSSRRSGTGSCGCGSRAVGRRPAPPGCRRSPTAARRR